MENPFYGTFTLGQTLQRGWLLFRTALPTIFPLILVSFLISLYTYSLISEYPSGLDEDPFQFITPGYLLSMLYLGWFWICTTRTLFRFSRGEHPEFSQILRLVVPKDLLYLITIVLVYIAMVLSMLLLVIPFIYLCNILNIAVIVIIVERSYFYGWLPRTIRLVRGRWWKTFALNLIVFIPWGAIVITSFIIGAFLGYEMFPGLLPERPMVDLSIEAGVAGTTWLTVQSLLFTLVQVLITAIFMTHYNSLCSEKETSRDEDGESYEVII